MKMGEIIIQEQITVHQVYIDRVIEQYKKLPDTYGMGIGEKMLDKEGIIKEIEELTDIGKQILLMKHAFNKWKNIQDLKSKQ